MNGSIHQFVIDQLQAAKGRWPEVAEVSGVPLRTVEKIAREDTKNPGVKHVEALAGYFGWQKPQGKGGGPGRMAAPG